MSEIAEVELELPAGEFEIIFGSGTSSYIANPYSIEISDGERIELDLSQVLPGGANFLEYRVDKESLRSSAYLLRIWVNDRLLHEGKTRKMWLQESGVFVLPAGAVKIEWSGEVSKSAHVEYFSNQPGERTTVFCSEGRIEVVE